MVIQEFRVFSCLAYQCVPPAHKHNRAPAIHMRHCMTYSDRICSAITKYVTTLWVPSLHRRPPAPASAAAAQIALPQCPAMEAIHHNITDTHHNIHRAADVTLLDTPTNTHVQSVHYDRSQDGRQQPTPGRVWRDTSWFTGGCGWTGTLWFTGSFASRILRTADRHCSCRQAGEAG